MSLENMLLARDGSLRISDFGMARRCRADTVFPACGSHTMIGKPAYRAPECLEAEWNARSVDIYALGCCLFAMLTSSHLKDKKHKGDQARVYRGRPISEVLRRRGVVVSRQAQDLLQGMLAKPSRRLSLEQVLSHPWLAGL